MALAAMPRAASAVGFAEAVVVRMRDRLQASLRAEPDEVLWQRERATLPAGSRTASRAPSCSRSSRDTGLEVTSFRVAWRGGGGLADGVDRWRGRRAGSVDSDVFGAGGRTVRGACVGITSPSRRASVRRREPPCETVTALCSSPRSRLRRVAVMGGEQELHAVPLGLALDSAPSFSLLKLSAGTSVGCFSYPRVAALQSPLPGLGCCSLKRASPLVKVQQILERARRSRLFKAPLARADASTASSVSSRTAALTSASLILVRGAAGT